MNGWRKLFPNAWYVAVREYRSRVSTRSFILGTILLAGIAFVSTQAPVFINAAIGSSQTRLGVVTQTDLPSDARAILEAGLNGDTSANPSSHRPYAISWFPASAEPIAQQSLRSGDLDALLLVSRDSKSGDLAFAIRTDMPADGGAMQHLQSALRSLVIEDRLVRAGTSSSAVLSAFPLTISPVDGGSGATNSVGQEVSTGLLSTGLVVLIFMAIITYGTWVAMSVAEEKGSRVMELMLNATTPLQMLAGKVIGNGFAGLTQYGIILGAVVVGLLSQDRVAQALGTSSSGVSFGGLTPLILAGFVVLFVLGFLFYSLLYAALGSLVSRQEDVQSATSPLMMLIMIGYFTSVFAVSAVDETWVKLMSLIPFFSPYMMLTRLSQGHVEPWEFALACLLLVLSIAVALVVAARIYSAGVLLYGQRVGLRQVLKAARVSR